MSKNFSPDEIIEVFDRGHLELLNQIKKLCEKLSNNSLDHEIIFLISEIYAIISAHFKNEEMIMKQQHDESFTSHKVDHDEFLAALKQTMDNHNGLSKHNLGQSLFERCQSWFSEHFEEFDKNCATKTARMPFPFTEIP